VKGGKKSKRKLTVRQAKAMVRAREMKRKGTSLMSHIKTIGLLVLISLFSLSSAAWCIEDGDGNKLLSNCGAAIALLDDQSVDQSKRAGIFFVLD